MSKIRFRVIFVIVLPILLLAQSGCILKGRHLYVEGRQFAQSGDLDFAYMKFHKLYDTYPKSIFAEKCLFGIGEYYFLNSNYHDAAEVFNRFLTHYPESKAQPFVQAYLLKIALIRGNVQQTKKMEKEIINSEQLSFLFSQFKQVKYRSVFSKSYKAVYFIDRTEFYVGGVLIAKVLY